MHACTHTPAHTHTHTSTHTHTHTHTCMHVCTHTTHTSNACTHTQLHATLVHTHTWTHAHTPAHTSTPSNIQTHTPHTSHACTHTITHTPAHTHTHYCLTLPYLQEGETALHCACWHGYQSIVECLVRSGCSLILVNKDSETCLHVAAVRGHYNTVRLLCQAGADLNTQDKVCVCMYIHRCFVGMWGRTECVYVQYVCVHFCVHLCVHLCVWVFSSSTCAEWLCACSLGNKTKPPGHCAILVQPWGGARHHRQIGGNSPPRCLQGWSSFLGPNPVCCWVQPQSPKQGKDNETDRQTDRQTNKEQAIVSV